MIWYLPPDVPGLLVLVDLGQLDAEAAHVRIGLLDSSHRLGGGMGGGREGGEER